MFAPGLEQVMREFRSTNSSLASFVVSVYILGYAVGPLFMAPLSELYGRLPVYHVSNALLSAGADGGDGWKKLVCPLKLWRKELFKYMSVGQAAAGSRGTTPLPPPELVTYFQLPCTS
jgi:MFS family permease